MAAATAEMIPVDRLAESRFNPRRSNDDAAEAHLAASIIALGILQPLVVRPSPDNPVRYEVAAGNRRLRAVKAAITGGRLAADFEFPCLVCELTDHDMRVIALAENLARAELTPFEQGDEIAYLIDPRGADGQRVPGAVVLSLQQVADLSGITPGLAQRRLSLALGAAPAVRAACERNEIALHHAEALAAYGEKGQQLNLLPAIIRDRSAWDSRRIREALKPVDILVGCAFFDVALYPADKIFTDLFGDQWLTDREAFLRLQREAAQVHCAELAAVWAWARIHKGGRLFNSWDYDRDIAPGDGGGAMTITGTVAGQRIRRRAQSDDPRLVREEAAALEAELLRTQWHSERRGTRSFAAAVTSYVEAAPRREADRLRLNRILMAIGNPSLGEIDQDTLSRLRTALLRPTAGPATFRREILTPVRAVLNYAHEHGWCDAPVFVAPKESQGRTLYLLPAEAEWLIAAAAPHLRVLLLLLLVSGARMGEALRLE